MFILQSTLVHKYNAIQINNKWAKIPIFRSETFHTICIPSIQRREWHSRVTGEVVEAAFRTEGMAKAVHPVAEGVAVAKQVVADLPLLMVVEEAWEELVEVVASAAYQGEVA